MTKIYPCFHPYGNYLDNYYTDDYETMIEGLIAFSLSNYSEDIQSVNLGITDGVNIINTLKGDFTRYNLCIVESEDGNRDIYKITKKEFIKKDIWRIYMTLDVFSKNFSNVIESTVLVNRLGYRNWYDFNPILFNKEEMQLSNIKTEQIPISFSGISQETLNEIQKQNSDVKIKGYLIFIQKDQCQGLTITTGIDGATNYDYTVNTKSDFVLYGKTLTKSLKWYTNDKGRSDGWNTVQMFGLYCFYKWQIADKKAVEIHKPTADSEIYLQQRNWSMDITKRLMRGYSVWTGTGYFGDDDDKPDIDINTFNNEMLSYLKQYIQQGLEYDVYSSYNNKIVYVQDEQKYYRIRFSSTSTRKTEVNITDEAILDTIFQTPVFAYEDSGINLTCEEEYLQVNLDETTSVSSFTIELPQLRNTIDQGYVVLWVPKFNNADFRGSSVYNFKINQNLIDSCITSLREKYGGENGIILDIQETYFVPSEIAYDWKYDSSNNRINWGYLGTTSGKNEYVKLNGDNEYGFYCYALEYADDVLYKTYERNVEDYKLDQVNKYILRSPSGATSSEFSLAKNQGITGFNLKYNCRPYGSLYQLQPIYKGYYGSNFCDDRGLVMLEDTSITQNTDLYEQYKRQNVNYISSFNSNQLYERNQLELTQRQERMNFGFDSGERAINEILQTIGQVAGLGAMGSAYGFNATGMQTGMGVAGIVGTGVQEGLELAQLLKNQKYERQQLQLSQTEARKQWYYQLGNISALPLNTDKISSIYNTNYGFFYLEVYTPTDYELGIYESYLNMFGINVGSIIDLNNYSFDYIEGNVIKYNKEITSEEYEELNIELECGRRLYVNNEQED